MPGTVGISYSRGQCSLLKRQMASKKLAPNSPARFQWSVARHLRQVSRHVCSRSQQRLRVQAMPLSVIAEATWEVQQYGRIDPSSLSEDLQLVQELAQQLGQLLGGAWSALISPFMFFGDAWLLNLLFLTSIGLLAYGLIVAAPRQ